MTWPLTVSVGPSTPTMKSNVSADLWNSQSGWWGTFTEIETPENSSIFINTFLASSIFANSLDPDQADRMLVLTWIQTV